MYLSNVQADIVNKAARDILPEPLVMEQFATGFGFTEGPVWCGDYFLCSDIPENRILKVAFTAYGPEITTFRAPSGNPNGLTLDRSGRLISCEHSTRRVTLTENDGAVRVLADRYEDCRLNSPNDVAVRSDGSVYFTDPSFGLKDFTKWKESPCCGVYRVAPDGIVSLVADDFRVPNGLAFSPDESLLYINDTIAKHIRVFDVLTDGSIANGRVFIDMQGEGEGAPDGMKVDNAGNVYCTGPGGFWLISPQGECLARIRTPELPSNMAWGEDGRTMYLTARTSLYRMRVLVPGTPAGTYVQALRWPE